MGRIVKCCYCKKTEDKDNSDIIFQLPNKKYAHYECYKKTQREKKELDDLVEVIKKIHGIQIIPPRFFPFIQDLRNGTNRCQRSSIKKSKQGYRYVIIKKTYLLYQKEIINGIRNKNIVDNTNKLMYSYAIIVNKIENVKNKMYQEYLRKKAEQENKDKGIINNPNEVQFNVSTSSKPKYDWLSKGE